ncbi:MAG: hypothetical protein H0V76_10695 [Blastocatellia bacterium]|nr:hypothetical protein [Blastocatellia bacterium]
MNNSVISSRRTAESGAASTKFLLIIVVLVLVANAAYNYIPVAYNGANFRSEMDSAVVKGLAASGQMKPLDVVKASVTRAASANDIPHDAFMEIKADAGAIYAHVAYRQEVPILPFGVYKYTYEFNYKATPTGYLLKQ